MRQGRREKSRRRKRKRKRKEDREKEEKEEERDGKGREEVKVEKDEAYGRGWLWHEATYCTNGCLPLPFFSPSFLFHLSWS